MAKTMLKQANDVSVSNIAYYVLRGFQRISLVAASLAVVCVYVVLVAIVWDDSALQHTLADNLQLIDQIRALAITLVTVFVLTNLLMLVFPRVKRFQKSLVFDGVVIGLFLGFLALKAEAVVTWFVVNYR